MDKRIRKPDKRTGSRHRPRRMLALPLELYTALAGLASRRGVKLAVLARQLVIRALDGEASV